MNRNEVVAIFKTELLTAFQDESYLLDAFFEAADQRYITREEFQEQLTYILYELREFRVENDRRWDKLEKDRAEERQWREGVDEHLSNVDEHLTNVDEHLTNVDEHLTSVDERLTNVEGRLTSVDERLTNVEEGVKNINEWREDVDMWREKQDQNWIKIDDKFEQTVGAIGARWGMRSEKTYRNALRAILERTFGMQVLNVIEEDTEGIVFGRPIQIELDIIIKNGLLIICEIKSSMSWSDVYTFEKEARFYEQKHEQKADRIIIISPMIEKKAEDLAKQLNLEFYSYVENVEGL